MSPPTVRPWAIGVLVFALVGCGRVTTYNTTVSALGPTSDLRVLFDLEWSKPAELSIELLPTRDESTHCPRLGSDTQASFDDSLVPAVSYGGGDVSSQGKYYLFDCGYPAFDITLPEAQLPDEPATTFRIGDHSGSTSVQVDDIFRPRSLALLTPADGQIAPGDLVELSWSAPASEPLDANAQLFVKVPDPTDPEHVVIARRTLSLGSTPTTETFAATAVGIAFVLPGMVAGAARIQLEQSLEPPQHDCVGAVGCTVSMRVVRAVPFTILPQP